MAQFLPEVFKALSGVCCILAVLPPLPAAANTSVAWFSPSGTVKNVRQVRVRFSGQMVPFGELRPADPFTIDCPEVGSGRWADGNNWAYDFERDVPAGVACRFTLETGLTDVAGQWQLQLAPGTGPASTGAVGRRGHRRCDERLPGTRQPHQKNRGQASTMRQ
ncbi:hypothetical protein [Janthinobacterium agaricidamnosum]|uniref:Alpha-2-macroglobulin family protein n=1 Tax=Janthinobacterium agaricidamnosum NBRC 102515 = DSM 9628 TaxID=1349767 RepID=W0VAN7_9BURK|nr:hypothetical protein [Janthinobacterium agaricidamnosum]CDG84342.1 alpha-2-macroglobulin family protein [Janthinobacterium agaricidamnosum NBRC 102515 = DSM 9628]